MSVMNVVNLRDYQGDMVAGVRDALRRKVRRVLLQAPTGSGKTVIASYIAREVASRGRRVAFNVHRAELMRGTSNTFRKYGIDHGFVADGHPITGANVQICSIDTLKNRLAVVAEPDVVLWDECIVGDSLILTDAGPIRIEDVPSCGASTVLSHDGEKSVWSKINGWRLTGTKQTFMVRLSSGKAIQGTSNHPIFTARGWVSIGEIIPGDQVLCLSHWRGDGFSGPFSATHQSCDQISDPSQGERPSECSQTSTCTYRNACDTRWERVSSVTCSDEQPVYDISVEGTHRFFANGVLVHNCHHLGAAGWQAIMDAWPNATHIGLSATPWRLDGSGLDDCFEELIPGPSPAWLMERGHLSQYEIYAPSAPDMRGARKSRGKGGPEFTAKDASARMDIPKRTGDIIKHWRLHADGMRTIGFAINVADSLMIVDRFNAAGIPAAHLDGKTPKGERKRIIDAFVDGSIKVLFNVALFDEGFDLAAIAGRDVTIDCLIDAAPTMSLSRAMQRWGRVLRPKDYAAIILDHAGNSARHGFPDDERLWTLQGKDKTGATNDNGPPPPITCIGCFRQIKRPVPECCPSCGKQLLAEFKEIEATEGELKKVTKEEKAEIRATRQREERDAKSLAELVALAHRRKYPNPQGWAFKRFQITLSQQRGKKVA